MTRDELFNSSLDQLEFGRVLEHIAGFCASSLGVEHVAGLEPLQDSDEIRRELALVAEMYRLILKGEDPPVYGIYDIREALSYAKVSGSYLGPENFLHILSTLTGLRRAHEFFLSRAERFPLLAELTADIHVNRLLERHINDAIDETGNVRDNATRELQRLRREIIDRSAALRERLGKILRRVAEEELVTEEYVTLREGRLVLPVRSEYKRKIPGIIHGESQTGGTVFLEPAEIFTMNNEIAELTFAERREVERILRTLTGELATESDGYLSSMWTIQLLDSIAARARYAVRHDCVEPVVGDDESIHLVDAMHPILQTRIDRVVPMSIELDAAKRCVVITGPNAGGKTVAMKTLGLVTMMALSGIHPPARECRVHPCRVFTDIGDQQSIENDLSTFSAHMTRLGEIIRHVMMGDIVLLDEIGTGTDPDEGGAIAAAILDHLLSRRTFILATTHHSYLKIFAYETDGVVNGGMEFDTKTITPTYRLHVGVPGNSYAFELLERYGFDEGILAAARDRLGEERNRMTEIIGQLETTLAESRAALEEHRREAAEVKQLHARVEAESQLLDERRASIVTEARQQARQTLENANSLIENTIREIRAGASKDEVRQMRRAIEESRAGLVREEHAGPSGTDETFRAGDTVRIKGGTQIGELEFDPDEKGNVVIQFGSIRMRSHVDEIEAVSRRQQRREQASRSSVLNAEAAETRIDLRGRYADEAEVELEHAITAAMNAHIAHLEVIHGKGTGALRKRVHEFLSSHPAVAEFRLGTLGEGGAGVTIVELV